LADNGSRDIPNPNRNRGFDLESKGVRSDSYQKDSNSIRFGFAEIVFDLV
jgi:hypothetical protein